MFWIPAHTKRAVSHFSVVIVNKYVIFRLASMQAYKRTKSEDKPTLSNNNSTGCLSFFSTVRIIQVHSIIVIISVVSFVRVILHSCNRIIFVFYFWFTFCPVMIDVYYLFPVFIPRSYRQSVCFAINQFDKWRPMWSGLISSIHCWSVIPMSVTHKPPICSVCGFSFRLMCDVIHCKSSKSVEKLQATTQDLWFYVE